MKKILANFKNLSLEEKLSALEKLSQEFGKQTMPYLKVISDKDPSLKVRELAGKLYKDLAEIRPDELEIEPLSKGGPSKKTGSNKAESNKAGAKTKKDVKKIKEDHKAEKGKTMGSSQGPRIPPGLENLFKALVKPAAAVLILYLIWNPCVSLIQSSKFFLISKSRGLKKNLVNRFKNAKKDVRPTPDEESDIISASKNIPEQDPIVLKSIEKRIQSAGRDMLSGRTGNAVASLENLCSKNSFTVYPELADACFILYDCYTLANSEKALIKRRELIDRMLEELPERADLSNKLLVKALDCTNNSQDYYSAIVLLEKAIACNPKNSDAILCLAQLYRAGDNAEKADELLSMLKK